MFQQLEFFCGKGSVSRNRQLLGLEFNSSLLEAYRSIAGRAEISSTVASDVYNTASDALFFKLDFVQN